MGQLIGITAALALIAYMGTVGALVDYLFPPQAEVAEISSSLVGEPAADSQVEYVAAHTGWTFPIPYEATIQQSGYGIKKPVTRLYVPKSKRGHK